MPAALPPQNLRRKMSGLVSNAQSTPVPTSTRTSVARGVDPSHSTATVAPLHPIKRKTSLKDSVHKVQAGVSNGVSKIKTGVLKPFPKDKIADAEAERATTQYAGNAFARPDHKRKGSDGSSQRTIVAISPSRPQQQEKRSPPTLSTPLILPDRPFPLDEHGYPYVSTEYAPRPLSPIYSESLVSDAPLISATFDTDDLRSVITSAMSGTADAQLVGKMLMGAGTQLSVAVSRQSSNHFETQAAGLVWVDEKELLEMDMDTVITRASSNVLPTPTNPRKKREGSVVSTAGSTVEYYSLGASEAVGGNATVKGELELISVAKYRTSKGSSVASSSRDSRASSAAPLSAVPRRLKTAGEMYEELEQLSPEDSMSQIGSSASHRKSRTTKAHAPQHKRAVPDSAKVVDDEVASFQEARRQLRDDAASASSSADSFRTALSTAPSRAKPTERRQATSRARSVSVASSATVTTLTDSIPTPRADEFPAAPSADKLQTQREMMAMLQRTVTQHGVNLDVERVYKHQLKVAVNVQLQIAATHALANTLRAVGEAIDATVPRRNASGGAKVH
ncbi:hypothetical protein PENSPDRAFT_760404 [Peniophora sp. CONT]|nr:hypothetical protein PENSPDRAFT_760404 [Peniophora sp. CONT]